MLSPLNMDGLNPKKFDDGNEDKFYKAINELIHSFEVCFHQDHEEIM